MISDILNRSYEDKLTLYRFSLKENTEVCEKIYENIPCSLARSAYAHSPTPIGSNQEFPQVDYNFRLYAPPEFSFKLGDRLEITRGNKCYYGVGSEGFYYDSHSICIVKIEEVKDA